MPTDVLTLAGIEFDAFSTPKLLPFGGQQAMVVHKLPGGSRVIDTLGPDEADIAWECQFFGNNAFAQVMAIDGIRAAGQVVTLNFNGQSRQVIVSQFSPKNRRFPVWFEYTIVCTVYQNPMLGNLTPTINSMDTLVQSDLATGADAAGISPANALCLWNRTRMTIPAKVITEWSALQAQVAAAAPLANASRATTVALQLNAGQLVSDVQAALVASTNLDNWVAPPDPAAMVSGFLGVVENGNDQSSLSLMRGVAGRVASNLEQLP